MDDNSIIMKVVNYFWLLIVLIPFFGGIGFIYAGWRVDETKWMDEGIIYMIPFILLSFTILNMIIVYVGIIFWILAIIRAAFIFKTYREKLIEKDIARQHELNDHINESNDRLKSFFEEQESDKDIISLDYDEKVNKSFSSLNNKKIYINLASYDELLSIPYFDDELAKKVLNLRDMGQYIDSSNDLSSKLDLSDEDIDKIVSHIIFEKEKNVRRLDL